jgi:hypothetical protein
MRSWIVSGITAGLVLVPAGIANADPVGSPRMSYGTVVCGDVTYTVVSPDNAPVGQMLTANGSDSTSVQIMIVDKAGSQFPQNLLTLCTAYPADPDQGEPFTAYFLITPVA